MRLGWLPTRIPVLSLEGGLLSRVCRESSGRFQPFPSTGGACFSLLARPGSLELVGQLAWLETVLGAVSLPQAVACRLSPDHHALGGQGEIPLVSKGSVLAY